MRVVTWNVRNGRALDPSSLWWRRRGLVARVIESLDADVWAMQEAYRFQIAWLRGVLPAAGWAVAGRGRNARGGGEHVPVWWRTEHHERVDDTTRWFGPTPDTPGSRQPGAAFPRIATIVELRRRADGTPWRIVNVHLDERSPEHRAQAAEQLLDWIGPIGDRPTVVLGDLNGAPTERVVQLLEQAGLRRTVGDDAGATANGFGRRVEEQLQIDHVLVSDHWRVASARIATEAGLASDHWPVVVDLELESG